MQPAGQDPEARLAPGTGTLPLYSRPNASPFWIMLLLVWRRSEHGMIPAAFPHLRDCVLDKLAVTSEGARGDAVRGRPCRLRVPARRRRRLPPRRGLAPDQGG